MPSLRLLLVWTGRRPEYSSTKPILTDSDFPAGSNVTQCTSPLSAETLVKNAPDAVMVAHVLDRSAALEAVWSIRRLCAEVPIILLAWESSEEFVIDAFHAGVSRFVKYPWSPATLATTLIEFGGDSSSEGPAPEGSDLRGSSSLVGRSPSMCELRRYISQVARSQSNVLITGETGTGKELVAQLLHENSERWRRPFVCLNCAAIPEALVESELFGYEKGAFTGALSPQEGKLAAANHGTVFFDEVGDVTPAVQAKLLRAIESKKVYRLGSSRGHDLDIRILAATNQDLEEATLQNRFRGDLYYRLNVVRIEVPPLRERVEDLPALVEHYIGHFNPIFRKRVTGFSTNAMDLLYAYSWPGNVRELRNVLEAAFVNLSNQSNGIVDLPNPVTRHITRSTTHNANEKTLLLRTLAATNWNKTEAAKTLHWSRMTLYRKMTRYQV